MREKATEVPELRPFFLQPLFLFQDLEMGRFYFVSPLFGSPLLDYEKWKTFELDESQMSREEY